MFGVPPVPPVQQAQDETYTLAPDKEPAVVRDWRIAKFVELGFSSAAAELLADIDASWHQAQRMIHAGCPVSLALEILV